MMKSFGEPLLSFSKLVCLTSRQFLIFGEALLFRTTLYSAMMVGAQEKDRELCVGDICFNGRDRWWRKSKMTVQEVLSKLEMVFIFRRIDRAAFKLSKSQRRYLKK